MEKEVFVIAGPLPIHPEVMKAASVPMFSHRSPRFQVIFQRTAENIGKIIGTKNDVYLVPSSGTGCMEAAIANFFSEGDTIIVVDNGLFGQKFAANCRKFRLNTVVLKEDWGQPANVERILSTLESTPQAKGLFFVHSETSAGVLTEVPDITRPVREKYPDLVIIVDSVSGIGACPFCMDAWNVDVVVTASQKAWGGIPGLGIISVHERMWEYYASSDLPKYYFDLNNIREEHKNHMTFTTPSVYAVTALDRAVQLLLEEGPENRYAYCRAMRDYVIERGEKMGLLVPTKLEYATPSVTSLLLPDNMDAVQFRKKLLEEENVMVAPGLGEYGPCGFRIGHMGYIQMEDLEAALDGCQRVLNRM